MDIRSLNTVFKLRNGNLCCVMGAGIDSVMCRWDSGSLAFFAVTSCDNYDLGGEHRYSTAFDIVAYSMCGSQRFAANTVISVDMDRISWDWEEPQQLRVTHSQIAEKFGVDNSSLVIVLDEGCRLTPDHKQIIGKE